MKNITSASILFFFLGLGLFLWTANPSGRVVESYSFNSDSYLLPDELNCSFSDNLFGSVYIVNYPKNVRYKDSEKISVTIEKSDLLIRNNSHDYPSGPCTIALEVRIDVKEMVIEPGNQIIVPYMGAETQKISFEINPLTTRLKKGTIWIYAIVSNKLDKKVNRIPLFSIPFTIQVISMFGIPPRI